MPTPDPSLLPMAVWVVGLDPTAVTQQLFDVMLAGFGVIGSLIAALLVLQAFRRPG